MKRSLTPWVLALAFSAVLWAHPHVGIDAKLQFEFESELCTGFWEDWTFDVVFSAQLINDFDANKNGSFEPAEIAKVQAGAFSNLKKYGYFTFMRKGSTRLAPQAVDGFSARIDTGKVSYRFRVPLDGKTYGDDFYVAVFDTTFYCAIRYTEDSASLVGLADPASMAWSRELNKKFPVYYNPSGTPTDGTVYKTWQKGLETAFPEEIRVARSQ